MKIIISHSYFLKLDPKEAAANKPYPPLAPLYLSALIRQELGIQPLFYDVMFDDKIDGLKNFIAHHRPDLVLIYDDDFNFLTKMCLENMRREILKLVDCKPANTIFAAHGSDASDHADLYLRKGFDYIIHRNAEGIVLDLIRNLQQDTFIKSLNSISYSENNEIIHTSMQTRQEWIEKIPIADWQAIDLTKYEQVWRKYHGYFSLNISTAHGCPYRCNWCAKPLYGRSYKLRPVETVVDEFASLQKDLKADHIWVTDDIFGLNPKWLSQFADQIKSRGISIPYKIQARADLMNESYVTDLKRSGCEEVWLGAESGSQKILDAMEKDETIDQIKKARKLLGDAGIKTAFFLQYGYPGEDFRDIRETLQLVRQTLPDAIGISVSYPLKGTPFYEKVMQDMQDKHNWDDSGDLAMMYKGTYHPDFYRALHKYTHHYFGFFSLLRRQSLLKFLRRTAAQIRHIPGLLKYRLVMQKYL